MMRPEGGHPNASGLLTRRVHGLWLPSGALNDRHTQGITMATQDPTESTLGHFDRWMTLEPLLVNYSPPRPENVTIDEFLAWTEAERDSFDEKRMQRIASSIVIKTPKVVELLTEVHYASLFAGRAVGRTGVFLTGPAAVGKTTAAMHAMLESFTRHVKRYPNWKEIGHVPVVYVEVPPGCTAKAIMGRILVFLGVPCHPRMTLEERTRLATTHLSRAHTSLVVIDELQNLAKLTTGNSESAQAIKNLLNAVNAVPLYVGIDLGKTMLNNEQVGAQFAGRSTLVELDRLGNTTVAEKKLWGGVVDGFERQLGLFNHPRGYLAPHKDFLWRATQGSLGALSRQLATAAMILINAKDPSAETITPELLSTIRADLVTERAIDLAGQRPAAPRGRTARRAA